MLTRPKVDCPRDRQATCPEASQRRARWSWTKLAPSLSLLLLGACVEESTSRAPLPVAPLEVGPTAASNLRALASAWTDASGWMEDAPMAGWLVELADEAAAGASDGEVTEPIPTEDEPAPSVAELADELADRLEAELFVADNLVRSDATSAVYRIPVDMLCTSEPDPIGDPNAELESCESRFEATPLQVRVQSFAAGELTLTLLVGAAEHAPVVIELGRTKVAIEVDVGALFQSFDGDLPAEGAAELVLRSASGRVRVSLEKRGVRSIELAVAVTSPLVIDADIGGHALLASLGRSEASLELDAQRQRLVIDSDVGSFTARAPYQMLADLTAEEDAEPVSVTGELALDLAGQSARIELDESTEALTLQGLGLGPRRSSLSLDGATVLAVDLNAGQGRDVDVTLSRSSDDGAMEIAVTPAFDLVVTMGFAALHALDAELATGWAANETLGLALDGASAPAVSVGDFVRVERGRLAFVSTARPELSLEIRAGQCLGRVEDDGLAESSPHPFAGLQAETCPTP